MDKPTLDEHFPKLSELEIADAINACKDAGAVNAAAALSKYITRLQIESKPPPEIIIGDGVTVLRPGVWMYQEVESEHSENEEGALIARKPEVANEEWIFTRIGDVPGEME